MKEMLKLLAWYNQKTNWTIYTILKTIPEEKLIQNKGAFYGSILGILAVRSAFSASDNLSGLFASCAAIAGSPFK